MSRSNFLDRLLQVSPATAPFITASLSGLRGAASGRGGSGSNGQPGGGGGGGKGGRPGGESVGNNLSFPAIFPGTAPSLNGDAETFTFTTPYNSSPVGPYHFAQGVSDNTWQANSITSSATNPVLVNWVDIGDALETAPLRVNSNIRLELSLYESVSDVNGEGATLTGFNMTLLEGAKGKGKPSSRGPTELQGARLDPSYLANGSASLPYTGDTEDLTYQGEEFPTTYKSDWASVYAAKAGGIDEEATPYMKLSIQRVTDGITGLDDEAWTLEGSKGFWTGDDIISNNLFDGKFGPELNIGGKYIMGASGSPWQFPEAGTYILTFSLDNGSPIAFDNDTKIGNYNALDQAFDLTSGREAIVLPDSDTHNGLIYMLVTVPSSVTEAG